MNINVERIDRSGAERRKGSGEYGPQCPTGAVPKGLGVEGILYGKMNFAI